jgi:hypothetical protein
MAQNSINLKRGNTLSYAGYLPVNALPPGDWSAACGLFHRASGARKTISATLTPPGGDELRYLLTLYAPASEVALWAAGKYLGDVEFTDASALPEPFKASSDDFLLVLTEVRTTS